MKVKCIRIYNSVKDMYQDSSSWLTLNKEYVVFEIKFGSKREVYYRLVGDNVTKSPGLYEAHQFEITSNKFPENWTIHQIDNLITIGPTAWHEEGFWEKCYDLDDPEALEIYKREAAFMYQDEGVSP